MPSAPPIEPVSNHEIEAFLRSPLPRRVRLTPALGALLACAVVFWTACAGIGCSTLAEAARLVWLNDRGHTALAHVSAVVFEDGRRGAAALEPLSNVAGVVYEYRTEDGRVRYGVSAVSIQGLDQGVSSFAEQSTPQSERLRAERLAEVRRFVTAGRQWPLRYARWGDGVVCETWTQPPLGKILFLMTVGIFILGVGSYFAVRLLRWLRIRAMLLRQGVATIGTILHKRTDAEETPKFFLRYGYAAGKRRL